MLSDLQEQSADKALAFIARLGRDLCTWADPEPCLRAALPAIALVAGVEEIGLTLHADEGAAQPDGAAFDFPVILTGHQVGTLTVRTRTGRKLTGVQSDIVRTVADLAALAVANAGLVDRLVEQEGVRRELEMAAEIQRDLLPRCEPGAAPIFGVNRPARTVSGDFFDFYTMRDGTIPFALGDVSGKGMNAALLMAKTASLFRCLGKTAGDPVTLLRAINREIHETQSRGMFVTMVAGIYDPATGVVRFANAGHEPPMFRRRDRSYETFPATTPPLGILPEIDFVQNVVNLNNGEFFVFSDGLTEFIYDGDEMLGADGLVHMLEAFADLPLTERVLGVLDELDGAGWEARDDLTMLVIDDAWMPPAPEVAVVDTHAIDPGGGSA
jgi:sigma-B regulation protein RsbU (phosphoserine phosphatase)